MAQRVESTRTGGDRSINSSYSRIVLTIPSLLKNGKKKKEKKTESNRGECNEIGEVKIKEKWF